MPGGAKISTSRLQHRVALLGALLHWVAALILSAGLAPEADFKAADAVAEACGYGGALLFMALLDAGQFSKGAIPLFFVQAPANAPASVGLGCRDHSVYIFHAWRFLATYRRTGEPFLACTTPGAAWRWTAISPGRGFFHSAFRWGSPSAGSDAFHSILGGVYFWVALGSWWDAAPSPRLTGITR